MKQKVKIDFNAYERLIEVVNKRKLATATRKWIQEDKNIHALNYWYYRWFTNRFELYLINSHQGENKK